MNQIDITATEHPEEHTYRVDKMEFVVTPVHRKDSNRTIHDILLSQMKRDSANP